MMSRQAGADLRQNVNPDRPEIADDASLEILANQVATPVANCEQLKPIRQRRQKRPADEAGTRDHAPPGHDSSRDSHEKSRSPGSTPTPRNNSASSTMAYRHHSSHGRPRQHPHSRQSSSASAFASAKFSDLLAGRVSFADSSTPSVVTSSTSPTPPVPIPLLAAPTQQTLLPHPAAHRPAPAPLRGLSPTQLRPAHAASSSHPSEPPPGSEWQQPQRYSGMERQPETRPISLTQLVNEVKGIYVGLVMVESKCIEIDSEQGMGGKNNVLTNEQWQALITLHRTLLHEHHDFMLASQHPSASPALRRLAQKYAMPARMWRHGIHSFLELFRHRLPRSREHMVTFIYLAYSMMALLYETVPAFEDTWVECLGDLSRYRMAIEDDNQRVRDTWTGVSRQWYTVASDKAPTTGRLYHHLAILARPHVITQMYYYVKSLCVLIPFTSTRESALTLFDPILNDMAPRVPPIEFDFTKIHAILFTGRLNTQFTPTLRKFLDVLDVHIATAAKAWIATGARIAIVNSCGLLNYGADDNVIVKLLRKPLTTDPAAEDESMANARAGATAVSAMSAEVQASDALGRAHLVVTNSDEEVFGRIGDTNCYGYIHVRLVWMLAMARLPEAMALLERPFSWTALVTALNHMMVSYMTYERIEKETLMTIETEPEPEAQTELKVEPKANVKSEVKTEPSTAKSQIPPPLPLGVNPSQPPFPSPPRPRHSDMKPLPEDWALRGLLWADDIFPPGWFDDVDTMDDGSKLMETALTTHIRKGRILWIAWKLARRERWIRYDAAAHRFSVAPEFQTATVTRRRSRPVAAEVERGGANAGAETEAEEETDAESYIEGVWDEDDDMNLSDVEEVARVRGQELETRARVKYEHDDDADNDDDQIKGEHLC